MTHQTIQTTRFRPSSPEDEAAIARFLAEAFRDDPAHPPHDAAQFHWKYWQPREDWPGVRSFVLSRGEKILAHAGVVPGRCLWTGGRLDILHLIEWAALPGAIGAGGALLKQIARGTEALLSIGGNPRTLAMLPAMGFRHCGQATPFIRSLRPLRLIDREPLNWRSALKVARGAWWKLGTSTSVDDRWRAARVMPQALDDAGLPLPSPRQGEAVMARSAAMFRYFLDCPATPMTLHRIERADAQASGYFVLAFASGQARLVDGWVDSPDPRDWSAMVQLAVREAREDPAAAELATLSSDALLSSALRRCGFRARPPQPVQMLAKPGATLPAPGSVRVQMLDNDAAWLHAGTRRS